MVKGNFHWYKQGIYDTSHPSWRNDINTQIGCIDSFKMMTKNLTMEDIKVIFEKMLKEHEASIVPKNQEMFHKQE